MITWTLTSATFLASLPTSTATSFPRLESTGPSAALNRLLGPPEPLLRLSSFSPSAFLTFTNCNDGDGDDKKDKFSFPPCQPSPGSLCRCPQGAGASHKYSWQVKHKYQTQTFLERQTQMSIIDISGRINTNIHSASKTLL